MNEFDKIWNETMGCGACDVKPSEDAVSREAALLALTGMNLPTDRDKLIALFTERIQNLPPVTPQIETSEDCISREAVMKCFKKWQPYMATRLWDYEQELLKLPSVTPKYTDEEIDRAQAVEQAYVDKMVELAVEEVKRPKGKWVEHPHERGLDWEYSMFECSECHVWADSDSDYCPNCGAEMSGGG